MLSASSSDPSIRLLVTYLAQFVLGVILFLIFNHFATIYLRKFLRLWARSWLAFSLYMLSSALLVIVRSNNQYQVFGLSLSFLAQVGCFLQVALVLMGTYQLVRPKAIKKKFQVAILFLAVAFALVVVLLYSHDPNAPVVRYILRIGSRTSVSGVGFLITGLVVGFHPGMTKGMGQKLLALSFILFSIDQFFYFYVMVSNALGHVFEVPVFFGLIDMVLIAMIGISMVMWLLEDEREKLRKANQELDSFLYSTSHDLRAPIASILGLTYLGKVDLQEERARQFMQMIEDRVKKLDMVIGDILNLSRTKKFDVHVREIDFNKLLDDTITDVKFNKGATSIQLYYDANPQYIFRSDYNQLKIVLSNLVSNAVKYHRLDQEDPYIRVTFKKMPEKIEIVVEDNGQGIPAESVPRIFDMFYRASIDTDGTGLGLYIVKEALSKIKGTISVRSELGKGSSFTVLLDNRIEID
jgi:signal transduction histidine kinase